MRHFTTFLFLFFSTIATNIFAQSYTNPALKRYYPGLNNTQNNNIHSRVRAKMGGTPYYNQPSFVVTPNGTGAFYPTPNATSVPGSRSWVGPNGQWYYSRPIGGNGSNTWWLQ